MLEISDLEKKLIKKGNRFIVGTANAGLDNYVGPIVSCSIVLDYKFLSCFIEDILNDRILNNKELESLVRSFKFSNFYFVEPSLLNNIEDTEVASYLANFNCANKLVWTMLKKRLVPSVFLTADMELKEVVKSSLDSVHSINENTSKYIVWDKAHSLEMIVPKSEFKPVPADSTLVTHLAKKLATIALNNKLKAISKECPKYDVLNNLGKTQVDFVKKFGNTKYHRIYLKELSKYPINTLIFDN